MEHLDLAGVVSNWTLPSFEQQDAIYLSSSRQMLEPIMEETSEDEEYAQNSWNQYEHGTAFSSSAESETGSVIRIEINKEADSISERDFACPAKRARRSDEFLIGGPTANNAASATHLSVDDTVLLRRSRRPMDSDTSSLERFLALEGRDSYGASSQQRSSTGSRRFDEFYSESDSLSYQSLSRSSSLIQFESLERQLVLQEQHSSMNSLGNSSPSLLSFDGGSDGNGSGATNGGSTGAMAGIGGSSSNRSSASNSGNNSRRGSQSSLLMTKRFESADGRLHQTYLDLDKLNFDEEDRGGRSGVIKLRGSSSSGAIGVSNASLMKPSCLENTAAEVKSDSESSTASSSSSGNSILLSVSAKSPRIDGREAKTGRVAAYQRGGKNSAENLSEDSGYCEPSSLRRSKSRSLPKNFEKFCEEEEEYAARRTTETSTASPQTASALNQEERGEAAEEEEEIVLVVAAVVSDDENIHSKNSNTPRHYDDDDVDDEDDDDEDVFEDGYDEDGSAEDDADQIDICRPKINTAAARNTPETRRGAAALYDPAKNSPPRESPQRFASSHSPSPVSSEASSSSASCRTARSTVSSSASSSPSSSTTPSTCASAASFTWHEPRQRAIEIEFEFGENEIGNSQRLAASFSRRRRNSLPDIRDAFSSPATSDEPETTFCLYSPQPREVKIGGLEPTAHTAVAPRSPPAHRPRVAAQPLTSCDELDANRLGVERGIGGHQRAASVPSELNRVGKRRRRSARYGRKAHSDNDDDGDIDDDLSESPIVSDSDEVDDFGGDIPTSCSWSERRERTLQRHLLLHEAPTRQPPSTSVASSFLGYSYCDLTQLDYSGRKPAPTEATANYKRCGLSGSSGSGNMSESRKSSGDYETFICKGNFLLDELSEIYDKNASILNDRSVDEDEEPALPKLETVSELEQKVETVVKALGPLPPPRHTKPGVPVSPMKPQGNTMPSTSYGHSEDDDVQHVQLTIRKPPTRQRHRRENAPSSLIQESSTQPRFSTFGKTFDQDPTLIRTSYAQSLEKCNFDPKEISHTNLTKCAVAAAAASIPKRRFHSQASTAKKRNLVSSTPNLNAFDPRADEIEDDMYVSSAHTSMHQLPQSRAPKPLGILLPAGSRSSMGKEVSFCPVVSKYCWQEQSSEECSDPQGGSAAGGENDENGDEEDGGDSEDELLDNADATVIYNTKENEMIAARYNAEQQAKQRQQQQHKQESEAATETPTPQESVTTIVREPQQVEKVRALLIVREPLLSDETSPSHKTSPAESTTAPRNVMVVVKTSHPQAAAVPVVAAAIPAEPLAPSCSGATTLSTNRRIDAASCDANNGIDSEIAVKHAKCPTPTTTTNGNSGKTRPLSIQLPILSEPPTNRAHHILYASQQMLDNFERRRVGEYYPDGELNAKATSLNSVNMSSVEKPNGSASAPGTLINNKNTATANNDKVKSKFKADEKHPNSKGFLSRFANGFRFSLRRNKKKQQQLQQQQQQQQLQQQQQQTQIQQLPSEPVKLEKPTKGSKTAANGKDKKSSPGKSKSPDYVYIPLKGPLPENNNSVAQDSGLALTEDSSNASTASVHSSSPSAKGTTKTTTTTTTTVKVVTGKPPLPKQPPRQQQAANATHAPYEQHPQMNSSVSPNTSAQLYTTGFLESERSYYMYDDFRNQLTAGMHANGVVGGATGSVAAAATAEKRPHHYQNHNNNNNYNNNNKIGLIETNLDTHETVITGKTRSLMNIGPQQLSLARGDKHLTLNADGSAQHRSNGAGDEDDDDGDSGVRVKTPSQAGGAQIASVRRPHKSMEFLLDKENQKNVLVCT